MSVSRGDPHLATLALFYYRMVDDPYLKDAHPVGSGEPHSSDGIWKRRPPILDTR